MIFIMTTLEFPIEATWFETAGLSKHTSVKDLTIELSRDIQRFGKNNHYKYHISEVVCSEQNEEGSYIELLSLLVKENFLDLEEYDPLSNNLREFGEELEARGLIKFVNP
jgi:hypothetical protein